MPLSEFDLIARFFADLTPGRADVLLGVGDDCALLEVPVGQQLAVTTDTLLEGVHFIAGTDPESLGHKALAVNLSDLAAMGAQPAWVTLALTLPQADEGWLAAFARGFGGLARHFGVALVGGDMTRGPLSITVQAQGLVEAGKALRRDAAQPGDLVYVSGTLGDAGLALLARQGFHVVPRFRDFLQERLDRPRPRLALGRSLAGVARAGIDISDGLTADLGHVLDASACGATLYIEQLPLSEALNQYVSEQADWSLPLSGGDDYELLVTLAPERQGMAESLAAECDCDFTWIGIIDSAPELRCVDANGNPVHHGNGWDHFATGAGAPGSNQ
ncbi:MAG: thiamine-phosphate kinase [Pseudomonadota bacterium]